jgi:O-antigen ligase
MFGIGFGRFEDHADRSRLAARGFADASVTSVHNEYLTTLLKGGLLVAVTFVMFLLAAVAIFRSAIRMRDSPEVRRYGLVGLGITTVLAVAGLGAESFRAISVSGPFWLLVGAVSVLREIAPAQGAVPLPLSQEALPDGA